MEEWAKVQGIEALRRDFNVELENGIPHHDTFRRVLARLRPEALEGSLHLVRRHHLGQALEQKSGTPVPIGHIAIDGKELRGSHDAFHDSPAIMLLTAYASEQGFVLGHKKVDTKSNEIPAAVDVLSQIDGSEAIDGIEAIEIKGATITADALHCQRDTARAIREREADYLLAVKHNQGTLHQALIALRVRLRRIGFEMNRQEQRLPMQTAQTLDKDHGRIELRKACLIRVADWLPNNDPLRSLWPDLTNVLCIECERSWTHRGQPKTSRFTRYFISSSAADVQEHMAFVRSHWRIENSLHSVMDVTFGEDASRVRVGHEAQNLATLRRVAATLLKLSSEGTGRTSVRGRKKTAGWSTPYLLRTLTI